MTKAYGTIEVNNPMSERHRAKHFVNNDTGSIVIAGNASDFDPTNVNTYGYNVLTGTDSLNLRYNGIVLNRINQNGMEIYKVSGNNTISVAKFGAETRIGTEGGSRFEVNSDSLTAYKANGNSYFTVSETGLQFGDNVAATTTDIENIDVGGRNILRGTANIQLKDPILWSSGNWYKSGTGTITTGITLTDAPIPNVKGVQFTVTAANTQVGAAQGGVPFHAGTITQSVWVKGTAGDIIKLQPIWTNQSSAKVESGQKSFTIQDNKWHKYTFTKDVKYDHPSGSQSAADNETANAGYVYLVSNTVGNTCLVCGDKIEYGNKATDWTPAPEDVDDALSGKRSTHTLSTSYSWTYTTVITNSAENYSKSDGWTVSSTAGVSVGDTVRIKVNVSDMSNIPVYIIGTVTEVTSGTVLKMASHGVDTTVIDGGKILTNTVGADQIAANAITIGKIDTDTSNKINAGNTAANKLGTTLQPIVKSWSNNSNLIYYELCKSTIACNSNSASGSVHISGTIGGYINTNQGYVDVTIGCRGIPPYAIVGQKDSTILTSFGNIVAYYDSNYIVHIYLVKPATGTYSKCTLELDSVSQFERVATESTTAPTGTKFFDLSTATTEDSRTAISYITDIDSKEGVVIKAVNGKIDGSDATKKNYIKLNTSGLDIYKGGNSIAFYGDTARIGNTASNHVLIGNSDIQLKKSDATLSKFGLSGEQNILVTDETKGDWFSISELITISDIANAVNGTTINIVTEYYNINGGDEYHTSRYTYTYTMGTPEPSAFATPYYDGECTFFFDPGSDVMERIVKVSYYKKGTAPYLQIGNTTNVKNAITIGTLLNSKQQTPFAIDWSGNLTIAGNLRCQVINPGGVKLFRRYFSSIDNQTIPANSNAEIIVPVERTNYTFVGLVGWDLDNASSGGVNISNCVVHAATINDGGTEAYFQIRNNASSQAKIKVKVQGLYISAAQGL